MAPPLVAAQSHSVPARAVLALVVTFAGLVLWLPILGRVPGIPRPRPMIRAVYLVAQAVVPVFLSFVFILAAPSALPDPRPPQPCDRAVARSPTSRSPASCPSSPSC